MDLCVGVMRAAMNMPADYSGSVERFVVQNEDSAIRDLLMCLDYAPTAKRAKRLERLWFMYRFFSDKMTIATKRYMKSVLIKLKNTAEVVNVGGEDIDKLIEQLQSGSTVFHKPTMEELKNYKSPMKQPFCDFVKSLVNSDGDVYIVFAAVATIAYFNMLEKSKASKRRHAVMKSSKMAFKGGAALGQYLFRGNKALWDSMEQADKDFAMEKFIHKGDNDTSIIVKRTPLLAEFDDASINAEIGSIAYDLQIELARLVKTYNIEKIIKARLIKATTQTMEYDGISFAFRQRASRDYAITEKDADHMEVVPISSEKNSIYGTISRCDFPDPHGDMIKFYLCRLKGAFEGVSDVARVKYYAELLDVSIVCIDSAGPAVEPTYKPVSFLNLFGESVDTVKVLAKRARRPCAADADWEFVSEEPEWEFVACA